MAQGIRRPKAADSLLYINATYYAARNENCSLRVIRFSSDNAECSAQYCRSDNPEGQLTECRIIEVLPGENFMAIFTTLGMVLCFSMCTLGIFATLVYIFTMRVVIYDILSMAIIPTLATSKLFCNLCYILLWILPRSVVKIAIQI